MTEAATSGNHVDQSDLETLKSEVHDRVSAFCEVSSRFEFNPDQPIVRLHEPTFAAEEINAAIDVLLSTRVTMGRKVRDFERAFSDFFSHGHGVMSNSGSSANLLAVAALANPAFEKGLRPGDEVIVPALSWSTTVWPLVQMGLVPVIVDVKPDTLNIDPVEVERAIGPRTRALMPVHVYGNPCDMDQLTAICADKGLFLIEDCCEALGARYRGTAVGNFGCLGTFSFYFSHHMTTLEGGITVTSDFELAELMRILRAHGWVRETEQPEAYTQKHPEIDPKFLFVNQGYNLRPTELQGAIGQVQLPKLPGYVETRRNNSELLRKAFARWSDLLSFQVETDGGESSCFGFPMVRNVKARFMLDDLIAHLNRCNIETRPIICGNIARQPAMRLFEHRVVGSLENATHVMENGIAIGNHHFVDEAACHYIVDCFGKFFD